VISVETKKDGGRTVAVFGKQSLEFAVPEGGRLELAPGKDGRTLVHSVGHDGKPVGEANVASDSDPSPISSASGQLLN